MSAVSSARGKRSDPLDKKIPENPRYKHVRHTVDTGASISRYMAKMEELKRDYKFRKDEIFKRMKITTFIQLVIQVADYDSHYDAEADEPVNGSGESSFRPDTADLEVRQIQQAGGGGGGGEVAASPYPDTSRSRLEEVIRGVGEVDLQANNSSSNPRPMVNTIDCPYLLLDIREKDDYDQCHIITARSYPTAMLARSVNYETKEMLKFKNQDGKIIILYDLEETLAHRAATTLVERGYDNLFMLSGGLKVSCKVFPEGLVTGTIPAGILDGGGSKGRGPPPTQPSTARTPADKTDFTQKDLDSLAISIDSALSDHSSGSRLSQRPKGPGRSSAMSTTSSNAVQGRKPFKP